MSREKSKRTKRSTAKRLPVSGFVRASSRKNVSEYVLSQNGLRILYAHIPNCPTVTTNIVYSVGSQHEGRGETGLAHMLEHMLFKPTQDASVTWKDLENKGAILNATTWLDRTLYYFNLPSGYLDAMLAVEANRMRNLILTDDEFIPERANVLSEYEMYNSRPEMALEWNVVATAFQVHGYHHDTIGFKADIESYTTEKLKEFYDRHYWPNNATLIVAGDISEKELLQSIKKHFELIPRSKHTIQHGAIEEPTQEGTRRVALIRQTPVRLITLAFKAPKFADRAWTALQLALTHLASGETSVLYRALVDTGLATSVSAHVYPTKDSFLAFFEVYATEKASYEKIERIVDAAIVQFGNERLTRAELLLLQESLYAEDLFSRDGSMNVAAQLGEYVATGNWQRYFDGLDEILTITADEIQKAVRTYLCSSRVTIGTLEPPQRSS